MKYYFAILILLIALTGCKQPSHFDLNGILGNESSSSVDKDSSSSKIEYSETKCREFIDDYCNKSIGVLGYPMSEKNYEEFARRIPQTTYAEIIDQIDAIVTIFENECREVEKISDPEVRYREISTSNANGIMGYQLTQLAGCLVHDAYRCHCLNQENMKRYWTIEDRAEIVLRKLRSLGLENKIYLH